MTGTFARDIMPLLPAVAQSRDVAQGDVLRAFTQIAGEQMQLVEDNVRQLYEDLFIETSQPWVVPYIGELVGIRAQDNGGSSDESARRARLRRTLVSPRHEVADAVNHYRRKGTISVLEELANTVAGWPARAVEFYELTAQTQSARQPEPHFGRTVDVRDTDALDRIDGPFDEAAHFPDIRNMQPDRLAGRYHPSHVGLFVWRLRSYSQTQTWAKCCYPCTHKNKKVAVYTFNPLGTLTPLFIKPVKEASRTDIANEANVPGLLRLELFKDPQQPQQASADFYGEGKSVAIWINNFPDSHAEGFIRRQNIVPTDLSSFKKCGCGCIGDQDDARGDRRREQIIRWLTAHRKKVAVDPENGLLAIAHADKVVRVTSHYGFSADIGGGEYRRELRYEDRSSAVRQRIRRSTSELGGGQVAAGPLDDKIANLLPEITLFEPIEVGAAPLNDTAALEIHNTTTSDSITGKATPHARVEFEISLPDLTPKLYETTADGDGFWQFKGFDPALSDGAKVELTNTSDPAKAISIVRQIAVSTCRSLSQNHVVLELADSGVYQLSAKRVLLDRGQTLEIRAAGGCRPVIFLEAGDCDPGLTFSLAEDSRLILEGLLFAGGRVRLARWKGLTMLAASRKTCGEPEPAKPKPPIVSIRHCTLVPRSACCGVPATLETDLPSSLVGIESSIIGSIHQLDTPSTRTSHHPTRIYLRDSIVDGKGATAVEGGETLDLRADRCTFFGTVNVRQIHLAQDSIFDNQVAVQRPQLGGMRFCYVAPKGSITPPRYYCQPDLAQQTQRSTKCNSVVSAGEQTDTAAREDGPCALPSASATTGPPSVEPRFANKHFGEPDYARLANDCPQEIVRGAEDESEMGVFHDLYQPQREANLRTRVEQFTPVSMRTEIIYADTQEYKP